MRKIDKRKIVSLVLCLSILLGTKHSYNLYIKRHPEKLYKLDSSDKIISLIDNDFYDEILKIPSLGSMVPQGITMNEEYIFLSLYDSLKLSKSMIYVLDYDFNLKRRVLLDTYSHVGGISYDEANNYLWVSGTQGSVCAYEVDDVLSCSEINAIYKNDKVGSDLLNYKGQKAVSFLYVYKNKLYIGNYTCVNDGTLKVYDIECLDGKTNLKYDSKHVIPTMVQGVSFYTLNEQEYIIFSRSCGEDVKSYVQIFKFNDDFNYKNIESVNLELNPMLEQIYVDECGNLCSIFESNAVPYRKKVDQDYKVFSLNKYIKKSEN